MNTHVAATDRHFGPPLWVPAVLHPALFIASLVFALGLAQGTYPLPWSTLEVKMAYFTANASMTHAMGFLQVGSAVPLAIFTATIVSRLQFFGSRAAGPTIALAGGLLASFSLAGSGMMEWMLSRPGTLANPMLVSAFQDLAFALGGPLYMAGMGLLLLGVSIPLFFMRLVPRWVVMMGFALGVVAEISTLSLLVDKAAFLMPARFPAYVWMIAVGATLPSWKLRGSME